MKLSCWLLSSSSGFMRPMDARSWPGSDSGTDGIHAGTGKGSGGGYGIAMTLSGASADRTSHEQSHACARSKPDVHS